MKNFTDSDINVFEWLIERDYYINYYLDSLPAGLNRTKTVIQNTSYVSYNQGIPIGFKRNGIWYIYNHYNLHVHLNEKNGKYQIVGFNIEPLSIKQQYPDCSKKDFYQALYLKEPQELELGKIVFTYNVLFFRSNITFA